MNRKGLGYETLVWIPRLVYLVIVIMAASGLILAFIVTNVNVGDIESHILLNGLQFSQEGIAAYDSYTGRVYPGLVDRGRLTDDALGSALDAGEGELAARFVLSDLSSGNEIARAYANGETYANWQPIAMVVGEDGEISGSGRKFPHPESRYVYSETPARLETVVITSDG